MATGLLALTLFAVVFSLLAKRLSTTILTAPMAFIAFGFIVAQLDLFPNEEAHEILHIVAEIALILLLFLDAAQIDLTALRQRHVWPVRMLFAGLPLSIALGTVVAMLIMPSWPVAIAALVAAILAPTDAALGQAVVTNPTVPERVRRGLTVESGLNDGLALPAVLFFACLSFETGSADGGDWLTFAAKQLLLGPLAGIAIGFIGGKALLFAMRNKLTTDTFEGVGAIALAVLSYLAAGEIGGNGFIAAFVAGLTFGNVVKGQCKFVYEFTESEGVLLTWGAFFLLGLSLVPEALQHLNLHTLAIIFTSLFIVRPLAIWLSLIGTDASGLTRLFFGWFGPRGLATALFALLVVQQIGKEEAEPLLMLAVNAVWISALLHGITAVPGANAYARQVLAKGDCPENEPIGSSAKPLRTDP